MPLADGQVWYATLPLSIDPGPATSPHEKRALLLREFGGWHDPIPRLLTNTPAGGILRDPAVAHRVFPPFSGGPVTLVGDAAHGVDPILAQGAGVAVEDAYHLACALARATEGDGRVPAALRWVIQVKGVR